MILRLLRDTSSPQRFPPIPHIPQNTGKAVTFLPSAHVRMDGGGEIMMQGAIVTGVCRCCSASGGVCREILLLLALLSCEELLWVLMFVGTGFNWG